MESPAKRASHEKFCPHVCATLLLVKHRRVLPLWEGKSYVRCHQPQILLAFPILPSCFGKSKYVFLHFASNLVEENRSVL